MPRISEPLTPEQREAWGRATVQLRHHLAELDLFGDDSLAKLIETAAPRSLAIHTEGGTGPATWPSVTRGDLPGERVLDAVRNGKLWVNLVGISEWDARFSELADQIFGEFSAQVPGLEVVKRKLGVLISSPGATVHYHVDIPGQAIWQVRGRKRFIIYPAAEPFLKAEELELAVRSASYGVASFEPWFDEHGVPHDLAPGDAVAWPLNGPHRIENADELSVSLTSEHWTPEIRRTYAMNYGNGLLRHYGWTPRSRGLEGPAFWTKVALTAAYRKSGLQNKKGYQRIAKFAVDPDGPNGVRPLPESEWAPPGD
ncbi:hypothetical protein GCM10023321_36010 [Pseudonocardia eucalypti]|uniref:JmjC domain-containing protein n=1 Tax=Pseudonocardia eucalypti TaxID=648755 RepID=A0ABP9Q6V7_9PSEU|nr:hypothetical protein [Pseudonocardia eucalypti]